MEGTLNKSSKRVRGRRVEVKLRNKQWPSYMGSYMICPYSDGHVPVIAGHHRRHWL